jgi:protein kinase-like protein
MTISRSPPRQEASFPEAGGGMRTASERASCLTTDEILELLLGALPEAKRDSALEHIASCDDCRVLFSSAAQALEDTGPVATSSHLGAFQPGTLVAHRYCVERFLARGGMGEVYAARDTVLNERVALKTVCSQPSTDVKAIRRLKSEALLSRRIGHPNTCRIFEFGEHEGPAGEIIHFLAMELVEGETLGARLRREGPLPIEHVQILIRQVLGGLAEAHGLGIVHRDLKTENIMLREPTAPALVVDAVVMDFGLALRMGADERLTSDSNALIGSVAYMAPEQVEGQRLTPATDVYAFGIILFEMLTGQLPFRAATPASTALLRLHQPPPRLSSVRPELGTYWDGLVLRCLERSVERRFSSAREVLVALDGLQGSEPTGSRSAARRLLVGVLVTVVVLVGFALMRQARDEPPAANQRQALPKRSAASALSTPFAERPAPPREGASSGAAGPVPTPAVGVELPSRRAAPAVAGLAAPAPAQRTEASDHRAKPRKRAPAARAALPMEPAPSRALTPPPAPQAEAPEAAPQVLEPAAAEPPSVLPSPLEPLPLDPEFPE